MESQGSQSAAFSLLNPSTSLLILGLVSQKARMWGAGGGGELVGINGDSPYRPCADSLRHCLVGLWSPVCMWREQNTWAGVPSAPLIWMTHGNQVTHLGGTELKLGS